MAALEAAAKAEGTLTTIALPHDWCNYGEVDRDLQDQVRPRGQRARPERRLRRRDRGDQGQQGQPGPAGAGRHRRRPGVRPDGQGRGPARSRTRSRPGTRSRTTPRMPTAPGTATTTASSRSRSTPPSLPNVPQDWSDLLKPEYKGQVALAGDPRTSNQAIQAVYAAALANGGSLDDAQPGLDFFKQLNDAGNFVPIIATSAHDRRRRDADRDPLDLQRPRQPRRDGRQRRSGDRGRRPDSRSGSPASTSRRISAYAPHPNAAKLWMEFLYSDEGQNIWLKGYCHPIRYEDLVETQRGPGRAARQAARTSRAPSSRPSSSSTRPRR